MGGESLPHHCAHVAKFPLKKCDLSSVSYVCVGEKM